MRRGKPSRCTRTGCPCARPRRQFLCARHWAMLGPALRRRLATAPDTATRDALRRQAHAELDAREHADAARAFAAIQRITGEPADRDAEAAE